MDNQKFNIEPFTTAERLKQLESIDETVASLLSTAATSLSSIAPQSSRRTQASADSQIPGDVDMISGSHLPAAQSSLADREAKFSQSMELFLTNLHTVDVQLKRQLWGLAESGIITLPKPKGDSAEEQQSSQQPSQQQPGMSGTMAAPPSVEEKQPLGPNGRGMIGKLDVGLLNSQAGIVEEQLDRELWDQAKQDLTILLRQEMQK